METNEPLEQLARFSFDWAGALCKPDHGCVHYHRTWSTIRWLEVNGDKPDGETFFAHELSVLGSQGRCRILLSGAADTGLAAMILGRLRPVGIEPEFVLIDRCETTLEQNRLFARAARFSLEIHHGDVRDCSCAPVQAIVAHSFLNFFERSERQQVADAWARNLELGGRLLLSQRLLQARDRPRKARSPDEINQRLAVIEQSADSGNFPAYLMPELKKSIEALWSEPLQEDRATFEDVEEMLKRSDLKIVRSEHLRTGNNVSPFAPLDSVQTIPKCEVVAVKMHPGNV